MSKLHTISSDMNALGGVPLTLRQKQLASEFTSNETSQKDQELFDEAFDKIRDIDELKEKMDEAEFRSMKSGYKKEISRLQNELETGRHLASIKYGKKLTRLTLQYIQRHGAPKNVARLIRGLRKKGALTTTNEHGLQFELNDRTARDILRKKFGI